MATIVNNSFTFFPSREAAAKIAAANQAQDDDWQYRVEEGKFGFFVAIYDEDNNRVASL